MNIVPLRSLPLYYDENLIGIFSQGPGVIFVYWELSGEQWEVVVELGGPVFIRLNKVYTGENADYEYITVREEEIPPGTNNWYFHCLEPDCAYFFEIGCKLSDGSFFPLAGSEKVTTPPVPRFNAMPGDKNDFRDLEKHCDQLTDCKGVEEKTGINLAVREVLESMPFYIGYHTNQ